MKYGVRSDGWDSRAAAAVDPTRAHKSKEREEEIVTFLFFNKNWSTHKGHYLLVFCVETVWNVMIITEREREPPFSLGHLFLYFTLN